MKRKIVTEDMKRQMRELEAQGKPRSEIAQMLSVDPATVTRHLGPVRVYRNARLVIA